MTNIGSLLGEAAAMMLTGMVTVFMFLTVLVYLVRLMSALVPEDAPAPAPAVARQPQTSSNSSAVKPQVVAAISAAVHQYRTSAAK